MHCPEQPHLHSYFPLFPQRTLLTYDRSFCLLTSVPVPALRMMSFQISISSSTAVHTDAPCVRQPSRSWAVSGRGKMRSLSFLPWTRAPSGAACVHSPETHTSLFWQVLCGTLAHLGLFCSGGGLAIPVSLALSKAALFLSQPDSLSWFSCWRLFLWDLCDPWKQPSNLDSFPAEKQRRQTFLGWAALVFSFSRASKTFSGDDLLFRIPKLNEITKEGMGIMIVGSQEGVVGGLSSDASRSCRPGVGQSS